MRIAACVAVLALAGCAAQRPASRTYGVDSNGAVSAQTRSALNGSSAAGPQEIIGVYIPFPGTGLSVKAGLEWDGVPVVINPVVPVQAYEAAPAAAGTCATSRTVMVPETYYETETRQVPRTRMVPRTIQVPSAAVPLPVEAAPPCQPPAAPRACPAPAVSAAPLPVGETPTEVCDSPDCRVAGR